jgi:alpha-mannosidase
MNWMWSWQETVAATLATFRTMLTLMEEYPGFTFSQSQASVYHLVEKYDPEMMEEIKKRIKEGRWEVTASAWVETDKNMPCTESLLRHIRYTRDYLETTWGVDPASLNIDFSPDTFGHSAHIPEIDGYGGVQ